MTKKNKGGRPLHGDKPKKKVSGYVDADEMNKLRLNTGEGESPSLDIAVKIANKHYDKNKS